MKNDEQNFMPFIKLRYQNSLEMSPNSTLAKPYLKNIGSCAKVSSQTRYYLLVTIYDLPITPYNLFYLCACCG